MKSSHTSYIDFLALSNIFLNVVVRTVYNDLVANGTIVPAEEVPPPTVPMDYSWARVSCLFKPHFCLYFVCVTLTFPFFVLGVGSDSKASLFYDEYL